MSRYYDEKTPQCEDCGWYGHNVWPTGENAGKAYERCGKYGYILHRQTDEPCAGFESPRMVEEHVKRYNKNAKVKLVYDRLYGGYVI